MKKKIRKLLNFLFIAVVLMICATNCKKDKAIVNPTPDTTIKDIDGNVYTSVTIGSQIWMVENLKVTRYRNGDPIPNITDNIQWGKLTLITGAYCNYDNDSTNSIDFGRLYNWWAVSDSKNIAPSGWHVPSDVEWTTLSDYLNGESKAGDKLKEKGYWNIPNSTATNESGFTALPAGFRDYYTNSSYRYIYFKAFWWSSTGNLGSNGGSWYRTIDNTGFHKSFGRENYGMSVRCIKD